MVTFGMARAACSVAADPERAGVVVGNQIDVVNLREGSDLLHFADSAAVTNVGPQIVHVLVHDRFAAFPLVVVSLPDGQRKVGVLSESPQCFGILVANRVFDQKGTIGFRLLRQGDRPFRVITAVAFEQEVHILSHRFADRGQVFDLLTDGELMVVEINSS